MFLTHLVKILDGQDSNWRKKKILVFDGATWHTAPKIISVYERLNIPVLILSPYSYDGAPIELFFSLLKRGNLNPGNE